MKNFISFIQELSIRRLKNPLVAAFVSSWLIFNWDSLTLLFWGVDELDYRVAVFKCLLAKKWLFVFGVPLVASIIYVVVFPYIFLGLEYIQRHIKNLTHKMRAAEQIKMYERERKVSEARVLADPNKPFVEESVRLILEKKQADLEEERAKVAIVKSEAEAAKNVELQEKAKLNVEQAEMESKVKRTELDKLKFEAASQIQKSVLASNRFPSAFMMLDNLDRSLADDGINLHLDELTKIVSMIWGYNNFNDLINDPNFNNEKISQILGVFYDPEELSKNLLRLFNEEVIEERPEVQPEVIFDHLYDSSIFKLVDLGEMEKLAQSFIEENSYSLLEHVDVLPVMSEADTIYDDITQCEIYSPEFTGEEFSAKFFVAFRGYHRKDAEVPGLTLGINANVCAPVVLGGKGLGGFQIKDVSAHLEY